MHACSRNTLPVRSGDYVRALEEIRKRLGLSQERAATLTGVDRASWNRLVNGRVRRGNEGMKARPAFDTVAAMAAAVRMTLVLVPAGKPIPESAPEPAAEPPEREPAEPGVSEPGPTITDAHPRSRSVMAWLRGERKARRIMLDDMRDRLGVGEHTLSAIERGLREPPFGIVAEYAETLGLGVAFLDPEAVPFAALSGPEAQAVRHLVVSYVNHLIREGRPIPTGLLDAADRLDKQEEKAA